MVPPFFAWLDGGVNNASHLDQVAPAAAQFMLNTGLLDQFNTFRFRTLLVEE
jgi:hypothetical protein